MSRDTTNLQIFLEVLKIHCACVWYSIKTKCVLSVTYVHCTLHLILYKSIEPFCIHDGACIMVDYVIRDRSFDRLSLQDTLEEKFDE